MKIMKYDQELEDLWLIFSNIPLVEYEDKIDQDFQFFEAGTDKIEIWHWFDTCHSKGVAWLLENIS
jgi:hypothetical protein